MLFSHFVRKDLFLLLLLNVFFHLLLHHGMGFTFGTNLETCQLPIDCLFYFVFSHLPVIVQELRCELLSYLLRLDASDHLLAVAVLGRRRDTCIGELEV